MVNGMHLRQRANLKVRKKIIFGLPFSAAISLTIFPLNVDELMLRLVLILGCLWKQSNQIVSRFYLTGKCQTRSIGKI